MEMCTIAKLWYDNEMCVLERFGMIIGGFNNDLLG